MHTLPPELRFPKPPWRIDGSVLELPPSGHAVAGYLQELRSWRSAVLELLGKSAGKPDSEAGGLSERARKALDTFLASTWTEQTTQWAVQSPYNLGPFPASAEEPGTDSPLNSILEVLRWRAGICDCLSDIWNVFGDPYLELDECMAIAQFLEPSASKKICGYCLTEFAPEKLHTDQHQCLLLRHVRAKWPPRPPAFARWAAAGEVDTDQLPKPAREEQGEMPVPRRWWEKFWK